MKTPRIEEMVEQYAEMLDSVQEKYEFQRMSTPQREETEQYLTKALTQAHQAGIDKALEICERHKMAFSAFDSKRLRYEKQARNKALDDTIKALQDKK